MTRTLLLNWIYYRPVGHAVEAMAAAAIQEYQSQVEQKGANQERLYTLGMLNALSSDQGQT